MRTPGVQAPKSRPRVQTTAPGKAVRPSTRPIIDGKDLKPRDAKPALSRPAPVRKPHITRSTGVTMGAVLALLVALAVGFMLFRDNSPKLTQVVVYGGAGYTDAEIASMAGLRIGMPMSAVSLDSVRSAFSVNSAVRLESAAFNGEQGVELTVSRRSAKAAVNSAGIVLVIDEDGVILDRMNAMPEGGLVLIRGMDVTISPSGKRVEPTKPWQQSAMLDLLTALEEGGVIGSVEEMNLLDRFNIYLFTRSGIQVIIGEATEVDIKVLWMKTVLEDLQKKGVTSGLIDVSTGKNAIYAER